MKRRDFLKTTIYGTSLLGLAQGPASRSASAATTAQRTVVNIMLRGGADLRYPLVPVPGSAYADAFWRARQDIYNTSPATAYAGYDQAFNDLYLPASAGPLSFGIYNQAGWLKQQFDLGNVAIISNVLGSVNRRHDHSQLIMDTGDPLTGQFDTDRDGWGGRLVETIASSRAVEVSRNISPFVKGTDPANRNARVVHAPDTRHFAFSSGDGVPDSPNTALARALTSYYSAKRFQSAGKAADWPYHTFLQHEEGIRGFGQLLEARLQAVAPQLPAALQGLMAGPSALYNPGFGRQCASLYDSFIASDIFQLRVASMSYGNWDSHKGMKNQVEPQWADLFGAGKGLDVLTRELGLLPGILDNLVFVITTDFGRQLHANGTLGNDHGRGNYMLVIGRPVRGGVYGDMFPDSEIPRFDVPGSDIIGLTDFQLILAELCDWAQPGSGGQVFPGVVNSTLALEPGVNLNALFV